MQRLLRFIGVLLWLAIMSVAAAGSEGIAGTLESLGGYPCPDSEFTCVNLSVPLNHFDPADTRMLDVVFAVLPATGERKDMFVTATGGPGTSGVALADTYTSYLDPTLLEQFDMVFYDQRGVGIQCPEAATRYYQADFRTDTPEQKAAVIESAQTFVEDCAREMGEPGFLPYLSTEQAVEDLELFRQAIGDEQFWLYGESYGTQYAQTYAAAHPERLVGLILDGTVDLTLTGPEYYRQQAQAFNDVMVETMDACAADESCRADVGGDALEFYDGLMGKLVESPARFQFPLPLGGTEERTLTASDLEIAVTGSVYSENNRMLLQRAVAQAARGDLSGLARLLYQNLVIDPQTLEPIPDPTYSDALFYGVECQDYSYFDGTPEERAQAFLDAGDAIKAAVPRFSSIFYGDLPCVFWSGPDAQIERPDPLVAEGVPTLVLGATSDPATPVSNGEQVYSHLDDGYLITTQGGPHVTFGWGNECPDAIVNAFLLDDALPEQAQTTCDGVVASEYVPLAPADAADFADPVEALQSVDTEIYYLPEYFYWDLETPTRVGCPYGGTFAFSPLDEGEAYILADCAFSAGFVMTGTGTYNYDEDLFKLDVTVTGLAEGHLAYERNGDNPVSVTGEYDGQPFNAGGV